MSDERTTPAPHPIAALLTEEMRERVRAATFVRDGRRTVMSGTTICPLGVALGAVCSPGEQIVFQAFGLGDPRTYDAWRARVALSTFIHAADSGALAPEDVKPLLLEVTP